VRPGDILTIRGQGFSANVVVRIAGKTVESVMKSANYNQVRVRQAGKVTLEERGQTVVCGSVQLQ